MTTQTRRGKKGKFFLTTVTESVIISNVNGPVAQLGAHYIRIVGVGSSNLLGSTK